MEFFFKLLFKKYQHCSRNSAFRPKFSSLVPCSTPHFLRCLDACDGLTGLTIEDLRKGCGGPEACRARTREPGRVSLQLSLSLLTLVSPTSEGSPTCLTSSLLPSVHFLSCIRSGLFSFFSQCNSLLIASSAEWSHLSSTAGLNDGSSSEAVMAPG